MKIHKKYNIKELLSKLKTLILKKHNIKELLSKLKTLIHKKYNIKELLSKLKTLILKLKNLLLKLFIRLLKRIFSIYLYSRRRCECCHVKIPYKQHHWESGWGRHSKLCDYCHDVCYKEAQQKNTELTHIEPKTNESKN